MLIRWSTFQTKITPKAKIALGVLYIPVGHRLHEKVKRQCQKRIGLILFFISSHQKQKNDDQKICCVHLPG